MPTLNNIKKFKYEEISFFIKANDALIYNFLLAFLLIITTMRTIFVIWRITLPLEVDDREIWNAYNTFRFLNNEGYPDLYSLNINNYPPLYFLITSLLEIKSENIIFQGRIISFASAFIIAINGYILARHFGSNSKSALFGCAWIIATLSSFYLDFFGANDPHMFAVAISAFAFTIIQFSGKTWALIFGAFLMALSVFTKQNVIGVPLATVIILFLYDRNKFNKVIPLGIFFGIIGLSLCYIFYEDRFFEQMLFKREMWILRPFSRIGRLQWVIPAILLLYWKYASLKNNNTFQKINILILSTLFSNFISQFAEGVSNNSQFELLWAVQIGLSYLLSYNHSNVRNSKYDYNLIVVAILIFRLIVGAILDPYFLLFSSKYRVEIQRRILMMNNEIKKTSMITGNVSCSVRSVCFLAGKGFAYDDWAMQQRLKTKFYSPEQLQTLINKKAIIFIKNSELFKWDNDVRIKLSNYF